MCVSGPWSLDWSVFYTDPEFWQQFQNYAPPSLRVIRTKITYSSEPNTKVYGKGPHLFKHFFFFFFFFLGMSRAGVNTKDAMKKQIRRIHSVFSHVDP